MKKTTLMIGFVTAMMTLGTHPSWGQMTPATHVPVIKAYYAVVKARCGDPFYIYLEAEDPGGVRLSTMAFIKANVAVENPPQSLGMLLAVTAVLACLVIVPVAMKRRR